MTLYKQLTLYYVKFMKQKLNKFFDIVNIGSICCLIFATIAFILVLPILIINFVLAVIFEGVRLITKFLEI
jgi:hypothetical protein